MAVVVPKKSRVRRRLRIAVKSRANNDLALRPPAWWKLLLETRVGLELWAGVMGLPLLKKVQKGDSQPVLVFPGLVANDLTTVPLRYYLEKLGYVPYGWEQGFNAGPRHGVLAGCRERIEEIYRRHGRKISLIGWSLGGLYAREMAKLEPGMIRQVITMGSPFAGHPHATHAWRVFETLCGHSSSDPNLLERLRGAPPVPTTSIYSKTDGVVAWQCSVQTPGKQTENIEVLASHLGLGFNPLSLYVIADRLAQPEGKWKVFARKGLRGVFYNPSGF